LLALYNFAKLPAQSGRTADNRGGVTGLPVPFSRFMVTISRAARCWAVKELARRAGVSHEFFKAWTVEISRDATIIHLQPGTAKQILFRNLSNDKEWR